MSWWLALPILLLPILWHRQKRESVKALPLATARFLPAADPRQVRVWKWSDILLLLLRCLLLAAVIARLADLVFPWRGDTVLVVPGASSAWVEQQAASAGMQKADRIELAGRDALAWFSAHEREWKDEARILIVGDVTMPAAMPRFRHAVTLRTRAAPASAKPRIVSIASDRPQAWRSFFAAASSNGQQYILGENRSELVVWDHAAPPPAGRKAPLWWASDPSAFAPLASARTAGLTGLRYADTPQGRVWTSAAMPPKDPASAVRLFETWQRLHYAPVPYTAPSQVLEPAPDAPLASGSGALRPFLNLLLIALFAVERILTHVRRL